MAHASSLNLNRGCSPHWRDSKYDTWTVLRSHIAVSLMLLIIRKSAQHPATRSHLPPAGLSLLTRPSADYANRVASLSQVYPYRKPQDCSQMWYKLATSRRLQFDRAFGLIPRSSPTEAHHQNYFTRTQAPRYHQQPHCLPKADDTSDRKLTSNPSNNPITLSNAVLALATLSMAS